MNVFRYRDEDYYEIPSARLLWSLTHYDGPMTGIALGEGRMCYARCHQSIESRTRWFWLYPLTKDEVAREEDYQALFRHYIGPHCDRDVRNKRRVECGGLTTRRLSVVERVRFLVAGNPSYIDMQHVSGVPENRDFAYCETRKAIGFAALCAGAR